MKTDSGPSEVTQYLEVLVLWELVGEMHGLVGSPLRHHHDAADLLHLGVIRGAGAIQVTCNLEETQADRSARLIPIAYCT